MAFTLCLNSSNVVAGSNNTAFRYSFIGGNFRADDCEICISQSTIPYAFYNISANYGNNRFVLVIPTGATNIGIDVVLPDGYYSIDNIQQYIQTVCITNKVYLITSTGSYVYPFFLAYSPTYYKVQIICATVPNAADMAILGYTQPAGAPALPFVTTGVNFNTGTLGPIIGFENEIGLPSVATSSTQNFLSTKTPIGSTVNSLIFRSSLVDNNVSSPSDVMDGCSINTAFGTNIVYEPAFQKFVNLKSGTYSSLTFTIVDQNFNQIYSVDPNVAITLMIRQKPK
jgi:hypothetical protein